LRVWKVSQWAEWVCGCGYGRGCLSMNRAFTSYPLGNSRRSDLLALNPPPITNHPIHSPFPSDQTDQPIHPIHLNLTLQHSGSPLPSGARRSCRTSRATTDSGYGWMEGGRNGWMDGWISGLMDGWVDGWIYVHITAISTTTTNPPHTTPPPCNQNPGLHRVARPRSGHLSAPALPGRAPPRAQHHRGRNVSHIAASIGLVGLLTY
jgi:hypothetical protein